MMGEPTAASLPAKAIEIVASLAQHRVLSTPQVCAAHFPSRGPRWGQKLLVRIREAGLADYVESGYARRRLWHATERGVGVALELGALEGTPRHPGADLATGPLRAHTLAVNDAAICFVGAAKRRGDEFGPLAWRHEVAHPLSRGRGRRRRALFADAVLTYLRREGKEIAIEQRFLEVDRATLSVDRLAAGLARYAELHGARDGRGQPLWRSVYPVFPSVHCVLTGAPRPALLRRRSTALALLAANPLVSRTPEASISICLLEDLQGEGPFAPIFRGVREPGRDVDWLGEGSGPREAA